MYLTGYTLSVDVDVFEGQIGIVRTHGISVHYTSFMKMCNEYRNPLGSDNGPRTAYGETSEVYL